MKALENKEKILSWVETINKGGYGNSKEIVDTYNYIFQGVKPKQNYTTCGSCLRRCICAMNQQLQDEIKQVIEIAQEKIDEINEQNAVKEEETKKTKKMKK